MTYYLCSSIPSSFWNEVYSKTKEFAPTGSKFFPFGVDAFSEERQTHLKRVASLVYRFPLSVKLFLWRKYLLVYIIP